MMLIRIIIMLLIALFVESRQEAFGQTTDTLSLSDKVIRTASFATGFRGEIWQNPDTVPGKYWMKPQDPDR